MGYSVAKPLVFHTRDFYTEIYRIYCILFGLLNQNSVKWGSIKPRFEFSIIVYIDIAFSFGIITSNSLLNLCIG